MPFRPKRSNTQNLSPGPNLEPIKQNLNGAPSAGPDVVEGSQVVANLEAAADQGGKGKEPANGHAT